MYDCREYRDSSAGIVGSRACSVANRVPWATANFAAVQAALVHNIPVAHIAGGDTTEGAFDEAIRHSITKMAQLHRDELLNLDGGFLLPELQRPDQDRP